jgi:formate/nitrite transporter FocA (FNT family)
MVIPLFIEAMASAAVCNLFIKHSVYYSKNEKIIMVPQPLCLIIHVDYDNT